MNPTNSEVKAALADDAVEHIVNNAIVAKLIELRPNSKAIADWGDNRGFKCVEIPVGVGFMTIHTRPLALAALSALTPSPAVDLLRDIREAVTLAREALDDCDETEAHALLSNVQARIDAALKGVQP